MLRRAAFHTAAVLLLTALTQVGGLAWIVAAFARRWRAPLFLAVYVALSLSAAQLAPKWGRVALSCLEDGPLQVRSPLYCALNRTYVTPELRQVLQDMADQMDRAYPGTVTQVLDGSFPFLDGFPLLPHLSHDDGEKADLAFWYRRSGTYAPGFTPSPLGYFAFADGPTDCPPDWLSLRWDFSWLQPLWPEAELDPDRMRWALQWLAEDSRVGRVFVEPHLLQSLGVAAPKFRFQGCRAARHDDHVHLQL